MFKKDYELIAEVLFENYPEKNSAVWTNIVVALVKALGKENANFDKNSFIDACYGDEGEEK